MAEETKFPFRMYYAKDSGIITEGYHSESVEIIQIVSGSVNMQIGTDTVEAVSGDFLYIPEGLVFRATASEGEASLRAMVFNSSIIEENMENFDTEIFYMFYVQAKNKPTVFSEGV